MKRGNVEGVKGESLLYLYHLDGDCKKKELKSMSYGKSTKNIIKTPLHTVKISTKDTGKEGVITCSIA